jgi:hypothetical protein
MSRSAAKLAQFFSGVCLIVVLMAPHSRAQPAPVAKTNPLKVYMHYMPWFESPATLGGTNSGSHWQFNNRNPNIVDANGRRQIASHYYPKIGPYASRDPHVIEYHLLLMKYAGVDGVMLDWYGVQGANGDVGDLLTNSNAIVDRVDDVGLKFGVILEDRFSKTAIDSNTPDIAKAKANVAYLKNNYFNNPAYIRQNSDADPLLGVFGPITFKTQAQWTEILAEAGEPVDFLTLWYQKNDAGASADGEYAWIYQDADRTHLQHQSDFYRLRAPTLGTAGAAAYPGFDDYYQEGGSSTNIGFTIPHNNGQTLADTLTLAQQNSRVIDFLQLATWNDYGEGTMFEPTVETGFAYLEQLQDFTGVPYGKAELELIYRLYRARKEFAGNAAKQLVLDQAATQFAALDVAAAASLLEQAAHAGDFDRDGDTDGADLMLWQQQLGLTGLYPEADRAADADGNGVVGAADLAAWQASTALASVTANTPLARGASVPVPEPSLSTLLSVAISAGHWLLHRNAPRN